MPKWIHDRADRILADNPTMPKSEAFGIATQQAYATGKQPKKKGWGTMQGKIEAKAKYPDKPEYKKTAGIGSWITKKIEGLEAPPQYVSEAAQAAGVPEEDMRAYVKNIRPQRFMIDAKQFGKDVKPVWAYKEQKYNPLQQGLRSTKPGSPEEVAYLKKHQKDLDLAYGNWLLQSSALRKKYTGSPWHTAEAQGNKLVGQYKTGGLVARTLVSQAKKLKKTTTKMEGAKVEAPVRKAKKVTDLPDPGEDKTAFLAGFREELEKIVPHFM